MGNVLDIPSPSVAEFFARNGCDYETRNECLGFARLRFPEVLVQEANVQGQCSYTVAVSTTHLLQFRPDNFKLDMKIYEDARYIYKDLVSEITYVGLFGGVPLPGSSPVDHPPLFHIYLIEKLQGVTLESVLQKQDISTSRQFRQQLVCDLANIFATSYHNRVPSYRFYTTPRFKSIRGRIGSSLPWRAELLTTISDPELSHEAKAVKYYLGNIEQLPWCLTHGDLVPSNIMVDPVTGRITGLLDWAEGEWLPLGIGMYAIDECFGKDDAEKGFIFFEDHEELRMLFWKTFLHLCEGYTPPKLNDVSKLQEVEMARRMGLLLWRGIAFDNGRLDRLVEVGTDDAELTKLKVLLDAPCLMDYLGKVEEFECEEDGTNWCFWPTWLCHGFGCVAPTLLL